MRGHTLITVPLAPQMAYVPLRATHNGKRAAPTVRAAASSSGEDTDDDLSWRRLAEQTQPPPRSAAEPPDEGAGPSGHGSLSWTHVDVKDPRNEPVLRKLAEADAAEKEAEAIRRARAKKKAETTATLKARRASAQRSLFPELSEPSTAPGAAKWWDSRAAEPTRSADPPTSKSDGGKPPPEPSDVSEPDSDTDSDTVPPLVVETDDAGPEFVLTHDRRRFKPSLTPPATNGTRYQNPKPKPNPNPNPNPHPHPRPNPNANPDPNPWACAPNPTSRSVARSPVSVHGCVCCGPAWSGAFHAASKARVPRAAALSRHATSIFAVLASG